MATNPTDNKIDAAAERHPRNDRLKELANAGICAYPHVSTVVASANPRTLITDAIKTCVTSIPKDAQPDFSKHTTLAGRIYSVRAHGSKLIFYDLVDESCNAAGTDGIQIILSTGAHCPPESVALARRAIRPHDIACFHGTLGWSKSGQASLFASVVELLTPCVFPVPAKLSDPDVRYRNRPLDMIVNRAGVDCGTAKNRGGIRAMFVRDAVISTIEKFWRDRGLLRIETPILDFGATGASARPFFTKHNALDAQLCMRIATELALKKAVVAGALGGAFEVGKQFRNEDMDQTHNPEFTSCEAYWPYHDYEDLMVATEELFEECIKVAAPPNYDPATQTIVVPRGHLPGNKGMGEVRVSMKRPWKRINIVDDLYAKLTKDGYAGKLPTDDQLAAARVADESEARELFDATCIDRNIQCDEPRTVERLFNALVEHYVEPELTDPTFVCCHPRFACPLAKWHRARPALIERFELFIAGTEYTNAYTELNHPEVQRYEFLRQAGQKAKGDLEAQDIDEGFCNALELGLPPTAGWGIGVDRLTMLMCGVSNIRDVLFFSLMRPETQAAIPAAAAVPSPIAIAPSNNIVLVVGAGMMTGVVVDTLLKRDPTRKVALMALDVDPATIRAIASHSSDRIVVSRGFDVCAPGAASEIARSAAMCRCVVSMLPPKLHCIVASACIEARVPMVTSSYSSNVSSFDELARERRVTILSECGLDPGLDHALAARLKNRIATEFPNGLVISFLSACGGIPHPDCADDAPLKYRVSWSPGAAIRVLNNKAIYRCRATKVLADSCIGPEHVQVIEVNGVKYEMYPNRDSLSFMEEYGISERVDEFVRGTLRYPGFCERARAMAALGLTDPRPSIRAVANAKVCDVLRRVMDDKLGLKSGDDVIKSASWDSHVPEIARRDCELLGVLHPNMDEEERVSRDGTSPSELVATLLGRRAKYEPGMKDRIVMVVRAVHIDGYGKLLITEESLVLDGTPSETSAMAKCVGSSVVAGVEALLAGEIPEFGCTKLTGLERGNKLIERIEKMGVTGFGSRSVPFPPP